MSETTPDLVTYHKVCQEQNCHKAFDTTRPTDLFCSESCKTNASWCAREEKNWSKVDHHVTRFGDIDAQGWWGNAVRNMEA